MKTEVNVPHKRILCEIHECLVWVHGHRLTFVNWDGLTNWNIFFVIYLFIFISKTKKRKKMSAVSNPPRPKSKQSPELAFSQNINHNQEQSKY